MQTSRHRNLSILATIVIVIAAGTTLAQIEIMRSTADGGGTMHSTGGAQFELSGTIGQPDAGAMTGGALELTGGFWFRIPPGDCNEDGSVGLFDHADFIECDAGPAGGPPMSACRCFDLDQDELVDLADFAVFQSNYSGI